MTEHIFILWFTGSDYHQLCIIIYQTIHHSIDQIQSLLVCQSGNKADHVFLLVYSKPKFFLKFFFVHILFLTEIVWSVIRINLCIRLWVVCIIINTIHNTLHIKMSCRQQTIQSFTVVIGLNLLCIRIADCCNVICIYQTTL